MCEDDDGTNGETREVGPQESLDHVTGIRSPSKGVEEIPPLERKRNPDGVTSTIVV